MGSVQMQKYSVEFFFKIYKSENSPLQCSCTRTARVYCVFIIGECKSTHTYPIFHSLCQTVFPRAPVVDSPLASSHPMQGLDNIRTLAHWSMGKKTLREYKGTEDWVSKSFYSLPSRPNRVVEGLLHLFRHNEKVN